MTSRAHRVVLGAALALAVAAGIPACGDDSAAPPDEGPFNGTIRVIDNRFSPSNVTISVGDSVTWRWEGSHNHTVTEGTDDTTPPIAQKRFDHGPKSTGTFGYRFEDAGTVRYYCRPHRTSGMTGTIVVEP
jgi:plastocyanin